MPAANIVLTRENVNMAKADRARSLHHLQGLYTVVVGLALVSAITHLIDQSQPVPIRFSALPYFAVFLITLVPFYHGALRHLDITYHEDPDKATRPGALLADWSLLFIESCLLLALSILIARPEPFVYALVALLFFDVFWAFAAHLAFSAKSREYHAERKWAIINVVTSVLLVLVAVYLHSLDPTLKPVETYRWLAVVAICAARTIFDYVLCWSYYYPTS